MIHYYAAYDRETSKGASTIHLGHFVAPMDAQSLLTAMRDEGKSNVRLRQREVGEFKDVE